METQYTVMKTRYKLVRYGDEVIRVPVTIDNQYLPRVRHSARVSSPLVRRAGGRSRRPQPAPREPWAYTWAPWLGVLAFVAIQVAALVASQQN